MTDAPTPAGGAWAGPNDDPVENERSVGATSIASFALALFALLILVALGARRPSGRAAEVELARLDLSLAETITILIIVAAVLDIAIIALAMWKRGHTVRLRPRRKGWMVRLVAFVAGFGLLMLLVSFLPELNQSGDAAGEAATAADATSDGAWSWKWLVLAAALGLAGGAAWTVTGRHDAGQETAASAPPDDTSETPPLEDEWTYVVPSGADPRSRVIRAYAALEEELRKAGHRRVASEAPTEFSARIGRDLPPIAAPVADLTHLFLEARFSRHSVGPSIASAADQLLAQAQPYLGVEGP